MMIRSAPPASAHLAERPVPAPAPMIGLPGLDLRAQPGEGLVAGHAALARSPAVSSCSRSAIAARERRVVDVQSRARARRRPGRAPRGARRTSAASASGSWNGCPSAAISETPRERDEERQRAPCAAFSLRGDPPPELGALLGRRAHERDGGVVLVEEPVAEPLRHGVAGAEVDHVEGAERDDLRNAELARGLEPVGPGGEDSADEFVGELRRRHVEHAGDEPAAHERLHRLPARAGGVEHEHLVAELLQPLARGRDAGRGDAEHRRRDERLPALDVGRLGRRHPGDRRGRVGEDARGDGVDPRDVDDGVHHRHVDGADVGARVAGGHRRDHQLRDADRQRAHRLRRDRGSAGAAEREDPVQPALLVQAPDDLLRAARHRLDGGAAVAVLRRSRPRRARRRARSAARSRPRRRAGPRRPARAADRAGRRTRGPSCRASREARPSPLRRLHPRHAEIPLLRHGVGGDRSGRRLGRDLAGDHHELPLGQRGRDAEVLLDRAGGPSRPRRAPCRSRRDPRRSSARALPTARP